MTNKPTDSQGFDHGEGVVAKPAPLVFISYSHKDEVWKNELRSQLSDSRLSADVVVWDDRGIEPTDEWYQSIRKVMARATAAICLISPAYLSSDFCIKEEIPYLLKRREQDGMLLIFLIVYPCDWQRVSWLGERQLLPRDARPVAEFSEDGRKRCYAEVLDFVANKLADSDFRLPQPRPVWSPPEAVDIVRLPMTGAELFGREQELYELERAWRDRELNLFSLVAWGGMGKSTLVNKWLERMAEDNFRDAQRVFGWTFFSQGTGEHVTSADLFIQSALKWFGDPKPSAGSLWSKGERLARLIRRQRTLLVLDGLEPLQSNRDFDRGAITDPGLSILVRELARENNGLCVITTREALRELGDFATGTRERNLEQITAEAGRSLMRIRRVCGTDSELEDAARSLGNNAYAINLFAAYSQDVRGHPAAAVVGIPDLMAPDAEGRHPRRMMAAFGQRFGEGPEIELLRLVALFDRPAKAEWIDAVLASPPVPHLTSQLRRLTEGDWRDLLDRLRECWLLAPKCRHDPHTIDAHPLVREHFGRTLQVRWPEAFRAAHARLYEFFQNDAEFQPDELEEMIPLFMALSHGCKANRYEEALAKVFVERIRRGPVAYSIHVLGAFTLELSALSNFFEHPWDRTVAGLDEQSAAFVRAETGHCLTTLGRLADAIVLYKAAYEFSLNTGHWPNAALSATNLSNLSFLIGEIDEAIEWGTLGVSLMESSRNDPATCDMGFMPMQNLTTLGYALCQAGRLDEAKPLFEDAEQAQREIDPALMQLISIKHFRYCDWLLETGQTDEVIARTAYTLPLHTENRWLLDAALDHLLLGRAYYMRQQSQGRGLFDSLDELDRAVDALREGGYQEYLVQGLLARARTLRVQGELERSLRDLAEASIIVERSGMRVFKADLQLERASLNLAEGHGEAAREQMEAAASVIDEMGYHRRDRGITELRAALSDAG